jgi:hypothetical protein
MPSSHPHLYLCEFKAIIDLDQQKVSKNIYNRL